MHETVQGLMSPVQSIDLSGEGVGGGEHLSALTLTQGLGNCVRTVPEPVADYAVFLASFYFRTVPLS